MDSVLYFAYGANSDPRMMEAITGNVNLVGEPAILNDWELGVQRLNQIPDTVFPTAPVPISPRAEIAKHWGEDFETYVIRPAQGKKVHGTLWKLIPEQRELVRDWEMVDFGWYKDAMVKVETPDGLLEVQTEVLGDGQEIDRVVEGKDYPPFLNDLADFVRIAEKSRKEYFQRMEGNPALKENT